MEFTAPDGEWFRIARFPGQGNSSQWNGTLVKFDPNGTVIWTKVFGRGGYLESAIMDYDQDGNLYIGGEFEGDCDFDPSEWYWTPHYWSFSLCFGLFNPSVSLIYRQLD